MLDVPSTPIETLSRAYEIGKEEGLNFIYVGNYPDKDRESTYCPNCGYKVIDRQGYIGEIVKNHLTKDGNCPNCEAHIPGVWR